MTPVAHSLAAQMRPLALTVTPGMHGYRLAYAGGTAFEPVEVGLTFDEAKALHRCAHAALFDLIRLNRTSEEH